MAYSDCLSPPFAPAEGAAPAASLVWHRRAEAAGDEMQEQAVDTESRGSRIFIVKQSETFVQPICWR
jgi:hypothetical protein